MRERWRDWSWDLASPTLFLLTMRSMILNPICQVRVLSRPKRPGIVGKPEVLVIRSIRRIYSQFQKQIYKVSSFKIHILRFPLILAGRWNMGDMKLETL